MEVENGGWRLNVEVEYRELAVIWYVGGLVAPCYNYYRDYYEMETQDYHLKNRVHLGIV